MSYLHRGVTPSLKRWTPLVERVLIPDDSVNYSLVPLINQRAKGSPCGAQLPRQMSFLPHPLQNATRPERRLGSPSGAEANLQAVAQDLGRDIPPC